MSHFRPANDDQIAPAQPSRDERRSQARRRVFLQGKIVSPQPGFSADCIIRNLSPSGARISLSPDATLWDPFLIVVSHAELHELDAVWRHGGDAGVRFLNRIELDHAVPPHLNLMRHVWLGLLPR